MFASLEKPRNYVFRPLSFDATKAQKTRARLRRVRVCVGVCYCVRTIDSLFSKAFQGPLFFSRRVNHGFEVFNAFDFVSGKLGFVVLETIHFRAAAPGVH
jgi:hypothetical protein